MENKLYLVWYDSALNEILNVEKQYATPGLLQQLARECIEICEVREESLKKANEVFIENMDLIKTQFMGTIQTQHICDNEDVVEFIARQENISSQTEKHKLH